MQVRVSSRNPRFFFPPYNSGYTQDVPIIGTAYCENFFCYSLGYTTKQEPVENDWLDVITHNPEPTLYTDPVIDDTLGTFLLYGIQDSTYYIRLSVKDIHGTNYIDIVKISVDRTPTSVRRKCNCFDISI